MRILPALTRGEVASLSEPPPPSTDSAVSAVSAVAVGAAGAHVRQRQQRSSATLRHMPVAAIPDPTVIVVSSSVQSTIRSPRCLRWPDREPVNWLIRG
jgi:hypothetical protein